MQMWTIIDPHPSETFLIESLGNADAGIRAEGGIWAGTGSFVLEGEIVLKSVLIHRTLLQAQFPPAGKSVGNCNFTGDTWHMSLNKNIEDVTCLVLFEFIELLQYD